MECATSEYKGVRTIIEWGRQEQNRDGAKRREGRLMRLTESGLKGLGRMSRGKLGEKKREELR